MTEKGAVVITGASTGIGKACALHLDKQGYQVFAGVRKKEDGKALQSEASNRLTPIMIDVTKSEMIADAAQVVTTAVGQRGLLGLVNNAGIGVGGPLEFIDLDDIRWQLEVNVIGQVAVTQAFLPLLRQAQGRIINMSSIAGRFAAPFIGPYTASKFALEALSDSLRLEVRPWGIKVILIEPGEIATPIWEKSLDIATKVIEKMPEEGVKLYGPALESLQSIMANAEGISPYEVAEVVTDALTSSRPKARYLIGNDAKVQALIQRLPTSLRDRLVASQLPEFGTSV